MHGRKDKSGYKMLIRVGIFTDRAYCTCLLLRREHAKSVNVATCKAIDNVLEYTFFSGDAVFSGNAVFSGDADFAAQELAALA